jgi:hypothetical protein
MKNTNASEPVLMNVIFAGNSASAHGGGMLNQQSSHADLTNVVFLGNLANTGGGMFNISGSDPVMTNVTFAGNRAVSGGAKRNAEFGGGASPILRNCIIWHNQDNTGVDTPTASILHQGSTILTIEYSLVQGYNPDGEGNLDGTVAANNPRFLVTPNPAAAPTLDGNLRLAKNSPAIDVGNDSLVTGVSVDLDGAPRIMGAQVDMGAYEFEFPIFHDRFETGF